MTDVVTFGEAMGVLSGSGPLYTGDALRLSVAGAEANVAIGLARLGHSARWAGRVGDDELGRLVLRTLRGEGVDTCAVVDPERPTGLLLRERRVADVARVAYYRRGSAGGALGPDDVLAALDGARLLHVTGITPALGAAAADAVRAAVRAAPLVCLDVNHRAKLWTVEDSRAALRPLLDDVDVLVLSESEIAAVAGSLDELTDLVPTVVVKRGAAGAYVRTGDVTVHSPARDVPVVDVVGAGDAFVAGFLSATLDGRDPADCLERAVTVAAFAVAHDGDWEGLPTRAELPLLDDPEATIR